MYHHRDTFYLYYLMGTQLTWNGVGAAVSRDGIHWEDRGRVIGAADDVLWLGSGAVWAAADDEAGERFIMNFSEWRGSHEEGRQTIFFAESRDLLTWTRVDRTYEFPQDERWYEPQGRWDCIAPLSRPDGGYYGYWTANVKDGKPGLGFGESRDGVAWNALESPVVSGVTHVEVGAAHEWKGRYYVVVSGWGSELESATMRVLVGDSPLGPFAPTQKNQGLLVGNASYFSRFVDLPGEVLVNHQSWIPVTDSETDFAQDVHLAPLKKAEWDEQGTLRMTWWPGNDRAKDERLRVDLPQAAGPSVPALLDPPFDRDRTLILEGVLTLPSAADGSVTGVYLDGSAEAATAFLVRPGGAADYGSIRSDGTEFQPEGHVDRELDLSGTVRFRLVRKGRMTELYLDDVLMQCYCLPESGTGRIGLLGGPERFGDLAGWYCS
jgi:hypothetical protein